LNNNSSNSERKDTSRWWFRISSFINAIRPLKLSQQRKVSDLCDIKKIHSRNNQGVDECQLHDPHESFERKWWWGEDYGIVWPNANLKKYLPMNSRSIKGLKNPIFCHIYWLIEHPSLWWSDNFTNFPRI